MPVMDTLGTLNNAMSRKIDSKITEELVKTVDGIADKPTQDEIYRIVHASEETLENITYDGLRNVQLNLGETTDIGGGLAQVQPMPSLINC